MKKILSALSLLLFSLSIHADLLVNLDFNAWSTKTVNPTNASQVVLDYPTGWSFEANGDADGVTKWGNTIFNKTNYTHAGSMVVEIKGYSTPFSQMMYQEVTLEAGIYSFSSLFKGGSVNATTKVALMIKKTISNEIVLNAPISEMQGFDASAFVPYTSTITIPTTGLYKVGFYAQNFDSQCWVQFAGAEFNKLELQGTSNYFTNSGFSLWATKSVKPTNAAETILNYPQSWSFEANGDGDGVTKWGNAIFNKTTMIANGCTAVEIKGYATAYNQMMYQDITLQAGTYVYSGVFRGGEISSTTHVAMIVKNLNNNRVILDAPVAQLPTYNSSTFSSYINLVTIPETGNYRIGIMAKNIDSQSWVQFADLMLRKKDEKTGVSKIVTKNGINYIEYKGMPKLLYGIEARIDDYLGSGPYGNSAKLNTIYQYYEKTRAAGFDDIAVPVPWYWLEPNENAYNFSLLDTLLVNARKYDLNVQLIWFGSNVCGWSSVPDYIKNNSSTYPRLPIKGSPLNLSNSNLIDRELRVFNRLIDYLTAHDTDQRVYVIQIENEPDHKGSTDFLWAGGQKEASMSMMNLLGQIVHNSPISMVTRVNLTGWSTDAHEFQNYPGIDIVGRDVYTDPLNPFLVASGYFDYPWNLNHTPENGAQYKNIINLALASFEKSRGYLMYELRTTDWRTDEYDLGLYRKSNNNEWVERNGSQQVPYSLTNTNPDTEVNMQEVKDFNELIRKADKKIAASPAYCNAGFNLANASGTVSETKTFGSYTVRYSSSVGGEAYALEDENGEIILLNLKNNSSFVFTNLPANVYASIGYFDSLNSWIETATRTISNNTVILNAKEVAVIREHSLKQMNGSENVNTETISYYLDNRSLNIRESEGINTVSMYDINGVCVYKKDSGGSTAISLDLSAMKEGLYIFHIVDGKGVSHFIKQILK